MLHVRTDKQQITILNSFHLDTVFRCSLLPDTIEVLNDSTLFTLGDLIKIYVVGFDVGKKERKQLEAVAKAGHGAYYDAANAKELTAALKTIASQVVKTSIFEDDFNAAFLNEAWEVIGDSADNRTLSDGQYVTITEPG